MSIKIKSSVEMPGAKITNLAEGTNSHDAAIVSQLGNNIKFFGSEQSAKTASSSVSYPGVLCTFEDEGGGSRKTYTININYTGNTTFAKSEVGKVCLAMFNVSITHSQSPAQAKFVLIISSKDDTSTLPTITVLNHVLHNDPIYIIPNIFALFAYWNNTPNVIEIKGNGQPTVMTLEEIFNDGWEIGELGTNYSGGPTYGGVTIPNAPPNDLAFQTNKNITAPNIPVISSGTWTPALLLNSSMTQVNYYLAKFIRQGNMCFIDADFLLSIPTTGTTSAWIEYTGLPFKLKDWGIAPAGRGPSLSVNQLSGAAINAQLNFKTVTGQQTTILRIEANGHTSAWAGTGGSTIHVSGWYEIA